MRLELKHSLWLLRVGIWIVQLQFTYVDLGYKTKKKKKQKKGYTGTTKGCKKRGSHGEVLEQVRDNFLLPQAHLPAQPFPEGSPLCSRVLPEPLVVF